ncbi:uncharacterized protein VTP21DRAFT_5167 [Calcarisporiella thermophila]|uniref:uncharacterized protein n=1 Tax=Calcarisporiella thermophila TaxID=911321 RepID=UPI00374471AC
MHIAQYLTLLSLIASVCAQATAPGAIDSFGYSLIGSNLYVYGGYIVEANTAPKKSSNLFQLDLTTSFDVTTPPWKFISNGPALASTSLFADPQNNILAVYGGQHDNAEKGTFSSPSSIHFFDINNQQWSTEEASSPPDRMLATIVNDKKGDAWMFGGSSLNREFIYLDMFRFNFSDHKWIYYKKTEVFPRRRWGHTANLLNSGDMVIIGGHSGDELEELSQIYVFNTQDETWTLKEIVDNPPPARWTHAATVLPDNNILLYGGSDSAMNLLSDFWILNTNNWTWSQIEVTNPPPPRSRHGMITYGDNVLVLFGMLDYQGKSDDPNIYVLNTKTWSFVPSYAPSAMANGPAQNNSQSPVATNIPASDKDGFFNGNHSLASIFGIIIGIAVLISLFVGGYMIRSHRKHSAAYHPMTSRDEEEGGEEGVLRGEILSPASLNTGNGRLSPTSLSQETDSIPLGSTSLSSTAVSTPNLPDKLDASR